MRRSRAPDTILLVALLAVWLVCTALHLKQLLGGGLAWVGVYVTADPHAGDPPRVRAFWPGASRAAAGGLEVGDCLLAAGDLDLRGVGPIGFAAHVHAAAAALGSLRVPITYQPACAAPPTTTTIDLIPVAYPWRMLPLTCTLVLSAALVLLRRPGTRVARAYFLVAVAYALHWTFFFGGPLLQSAAWVAVFLCASTVMLPLMLRAALVFPAEVAPARLPWWPWLFALFGPVSSSWIYGVPLPPEWGFRAVLALNVAFIATLLAVLTRNFRRAGPLGRRQLEWVLLGMYLGTVPVLLADLVGAVEPSLWWLHEIAAIAEIVVPVCIVIAIVRTNTFDVDRLVTGAALYSLLSILVLAGVLAAVPKAARAASRAADLDPRTVQLALSLAVAAAMVPARRVLGPRVEQVLFRERHALRAGIEELLRDLASAGGAEALFTLAGERLSELVRPHTCVIYASLGDAIEPVFARLDAGESAPRVPQPSAVIAALRQQRAPLDLARWHPEAGAAPSAEERAALERLRAALVLPVHRGGELAAAICLGAKRSADIYTATDVTLLAAVAEKVSSELLRFDTEDIVRQERAMSAALLHYVPRPVAQRLTRGQSIEGGECEVSVLFVDIRGYSAFSEARDAGEVFSLVNRYTEAVSAVIQKRGGTVVEFLGDGLMAVFGAPDPLPEHARVAVEAAREVVEAVRDLALQPGEGEAPIAVGVGIASGQAFVGNVRTSDRLVYTAIGDVVNLASRIQGLTRELGAAVAIDASTRRAAGASADRFQLHPAMRVRGRAEAVDVYAR